MTQYNFGIGGCWAIPSVSNPTPIRFGTVKGVTVDMTSTEKDLNGQSQVPVAIGIGPMKISGTIQQAEIDANRFNTLYWNQTLSVGQTTANMDEVHTVPASSPYTQTVVNGSRFVQDLGVLDQNTGALLTRVASGPTTGQYSVSALGVYTFAAADAGRAVYISYDSTIAATGANFTPVNPLMGVAPIFELRLTNPFEGNTLDMTLYNCVMTGQKWDFKNEDFNVPNLTFRAFAGANGKFYSQSGTQAQTGSRY